MNRPLFSSVAQGAFLANLDADCLDAVTAAATRRCYPVGSTLFHQGDAPSHLFQICRGLVKVVQVSPGGAQTTLHMLGPGDLIGVVAVVHQCPFPATAIVTQELSALCWAAPHLRSLMARHPPVATNLVREIALRAHEMASRVADMLHKGVEQRVAQVLLRLRDLAGQLSERGILLESPAGAARHRRTRRGDLLYGEPPHPRGWQKQGLVANGRDRILILAPEKLAQIAGPDSTAIT